LIKSGIQDYKAGYYASGTAKIALGTGGLYYWSSYITFEYLLPPRPP